jgi:hypothetical protein
MHRPSGTTVVTAVLGALSLFGIVWSHDTKRTGPLPQATPVAATDVGAAFQMHSGAWRARPALIEEPIGPAQVSAAFLVPQAPTAVDAALSAPAAPATMPAVAPPSTVRLVPTQKIARQVEPPMPLGQALPAEADEPPETVADKAPAARTPAPPEGRMALSGPDATAASSTADRAGRRTSTDHSAPRALEHAPQPNVVTPIQPKFGLDVFKELERNGS